MIDRKARDQMVQAIRAYMGEEITAFQFDEALDKVSDTSDKTVQSIRRTLWFYYDDIEDHKIVASKEDWDFFNRLILLLESAGEMKTTKTEFRWHPLQGIAAALMLMFLAVAWHVGFGDWLMIYAVPFGPPSMLIAWFNHRRERKNLSQKEMALAPFPTISSLLSVRRSVNFIKSAYPKQLGTRTIRSPLFGKLIWVPTLIGWCMFSPIPLFIQMLPRRRCEIAIEIEEPSTAN